MKLVRINSVHPVADFVVSLQFTDGTTRNIDLEPYFRGKIFESIRNDHRIFENVTIDKASGTICWENGADIDPDVLYHDLKPAWADEEFFEITK